MRYKPHTRLNAFFFGFLFLFFFLLMFHLNHVLKPLCGNLIRLDRFHILCARKILVTLPSRALLHALWQIPSVLSDRISGISIGSHGTQSCASLLVVVIMHLRAGVFLSR